MADATQLRGRLDTWAARVHSAAVDDVLQAEAAAAPFRTGATRRGVRRTATHRIGTRYTATTENTTPQGEFAERGTRAHIIRPRTAKVLRFRIGSRVVYARQVNHPGTPARPWLKPTAKARWPQALKQSARSVQ